MTRFFSRRALLAAGGAGALMTGALARRFAFAADAPASALPPHPTPAQWAKSPDLEYVSLSPSGNHIAYVKEDSGQKFLFDYDIAGGKFQTFNLGPAKVDGLDWIDDIHIIVRTLSTHKFDNFAGGRKTFPIVSIYNLQSKSINTLFSRIENFETFIASGLRIVNRKGKKQVMAASYPVNDAVSQSKSLYCFDLDNADAYELIDLAPWETENWLIDDNGGLIARAVSHTKTKSWELDYYVNGNWKQIYSVSSAIDTPSLMGLGRDGKSLVVFMTTGATKGRYYEMSADGGLSPPLFDANTETDPIFDSETKRLTGYSTYDGWSHITYFDPAMQDIVTKSQAAVPGYRMALTDYASGDPSKVIIYSEGDDDAGTYFFINFKTGQNITIGSQYPGIPVEWIAAKTSFKYKAADGLEIEAYLTLPPNRVAKNLALVVLPHGGPEVRDGIGLDTEAQTYASQGYAVLQPNYRGSAGYGEAFVEASYGEWGRKMETDLSDGVRNLASQGLIDLKRVCIVGASYGGYAALAGPTLDPGVYNCAVDVAGISDLRSFLEWSRDFDSEEDSEAYNIWKQRFGADSNLVTASPIHNVDKVTVPILIVHGKDDTVVPFDQSIQMVAALKAAGKDVTFVQYDHEDHWETNETARTDMYNTIVAFLVAHNPPV